jgi:hypothetical protein
MSSQPRFADALSGAVKFVAPTPAQFAATPAGRAHPGPRIDGACGGNPDACMLRELSQPLGVMINSIQSALWALEHQADHTRATELLHRASHSAIEVTGIMRALAHRQQEHSPPPRTHQIAG